LKNGVIFVKRAQTEAAENWALNSKNPAREEVRRVLETD